MPRTGKRRVLFVGGGRRVGLASEFIKRGAEVFGYESDSHCPLVEVAREVVKGMDFDDQWCADDIAGYAKDAKITHIVPLMDAACVAVAALPQCVGSPASAASVCADKKLFAEWMERNLPDLYPSPGAMRYPKVSKPRFGQSSRGVAVVSGFLDPAGWRRDCVTQDFLAADEVSVDIFINKDGMPAGSVARTRERVEGGEVVVSRILDAEKSLLYGIDAAAVCCGIGVIGPANVQFIGLKVIEVNPRFGGGALLSIAAGFDMVSLALGKKVPQQWPIKRPLVMRRYHSESFSCE